MHQWQWDFAAEILPQLLRAALNSLYAAGIGFLIAICFGFVFATTQLSGPKWAAAVTRELVEFLRSTPLVIQLFFLFYVAPEVGLVLSPWTSGMLAIGLHYSSYLSEVFRGAFLSVQRGQHEACTALNIPPIMAFFRIIVPQALPVAFPGLGNYFIGIIKDTPILSVVGIAELMHTANAIGSETYRYLEPYTLVGAIFLGISLGLAWLLAFGRSEMDKRLGVR